MREELSSSDPSPWGECTKDLLLNIRKDEGQEEVLEEKMKKRKVKLMKRSRKSERTLTSCMKAIGWNEAHTQTS